MDNAQKSEKQRTIGIWSALGLAGQIGYVIAIPIIILALLGRIADSRLGTTPLFLLLGMFLAVATSSIWIYYKSKKMLKEIEADTETPKE